MSETTSNAARKARLRFTLIGMPAGVAIILVIVVAFGQFDMDWLLAAIAGVVFSVAFYFLMGRWLLPIASRLASRMARR